MKISIVRVGKTKKEEYNHLFADYTQRIQHFFPITILSAKDSSLTDEVQRKNEEGERILQKIDSTKIMIAMDERGKQYTSQQWAHLLDTYRNQAQDITWVIGGAFGLAPGILERANQSVSLSPMTLQHDIALLVLLEQIYRAGTILHHIPYHK